MNPIIPNSSVGGGPLPNQDMSIIWEVYLICFKDNLIGNYS